jgi:hypothetical protein
MHVRIGAVTLVHSCIGAFLHFNDPPCICAEANAVSWRKSCTLYNSDCAETESPAAAS